MITSRSILSEASKQQMAEFLRSRGWKQVWSRLPWCWQKPRSKVKLLYRIQDAWSEERRKSK